MPATAREHDQRFTLEPEAARRLGYREVDAIVDRTVQLPQLPVGGTASRSEMEARLREPLPEHGSDPDAVLDPVLRVHGRTALRLCTINPRTTREDVDRTIDRLAELAQGAQA
jgi:hypothetical protein